MSYAIIRNEKKKMSDLGGMYKHNHRLYKNSSNKDIDFSKTKDNYFIKKSPISFTQKVHKLIEKYNLLGTTKMIKKNRVVACEMIVTSDNDFFNNISIEEERRYFQEAFNFIAEYKGLGEEFILEAVVHKDEKEPHMHIAFLPVMHKFDIESGKEIIKLDSSGYWKGKDSYKFLQDNFYKRVKNAGFNLERGKENSNSKHYDLDEFKRITNYKIRELPTNFKEQESPIKSNNKKVINEDYLRVINKCNTMSGTFTSLSNDINEFVKEQKKIQFNQQHTIDRLQIELNNKSVENEELKEEIFTLKNFINKTLEYIEETYEISKSKFISIIDSFKTKKERINEQLKTIQKDITENLKNINFKMKGKDKYGK